MSRNDRNARCVVELKVKRPFVKGASLNGASELRLNSG